jgi:thiol-disulfide isomerase/thioredoxin
MKINNTGRIMGAGVIVLLVILSCTIETLGEYVWLDESLLLEETVGASYNGRLRVYVVEPVSRWNNYDGDPYHFGFLDFAFDYTLSLEYLDKYSDTIIWDGKKAGFTNLKENNIMVMAVVFNPEVHKGYAYPPLGNPFDAYYVDAAAGAVPGDVGYNVVTANFTHTVFVEEGTATWCPYCPAMAEALNSVYKSEEYPFYFVALIADKNKKAEDRLKQDYNIAGYPTAFFDGGKKVLVGGYEDESYYISRIKSCGKRDVHELNLSVGVEWIGDGVLHINVTVVNNEAVVNVPPGKPTITGPTSGKAGKEYDYTFVANDPNGDDVYFWIEWGDGTVIEWDGPYKSGEEVIFSHKWSEQGTYTVKAKAKDVFDEEGDWGELEVTMPKTINLCFHRILERLKVFFLSPLHE